LSAPRKLSELPLLIFPEDYIVITEDAASLRMQYFVKNETAVIVIPTMPSFPDNRGTVVLLNELNTLIDEVTYSDDWHFGLIANDEGISLERIDPAGPSQDKNNWHSAASTAGYGTPGYQNSQYKLTSTEALVEVSPKIFSPDSDGFEDFTTISYATTESGYVANITIFDAGGREVRRLVRNSLLGLKGSWTWDGLGENRQRLTIGTYIVYTEFFNLQGKKKVFKNALVLASRLN
jgi:hypothetical protein